ncbi:MAG: hypothetical protein ABMB14_16760 [Myxococcota bacterium]
MAWTLGGAGCLVHRVGWVETADGPVELISADGDRERLLLLPAASAVRQLDGHLVEIDGRKGLRRIQVAGWRVVEGPHALPVWVGPIQRLGVQIGVQDLSSGALVFVDAAAEDALGTHVGQLVAVEGYIDGPQRIQVQYWRLLD